MSDLPFDVDESEDSVSEDTLASRVLVVDDESIVIDVLSRLLARDPDIAVDTAMSAEDALRKIGEDRFDVLITDKNLPGMGGIELIEEARRLRSSLEAILITGYASGESVIAAFAAGASDYLLKPFDDLRAVRAKIRAALDRRKERSSARQQAQALAREAQKLLETGKDAPEQEWQKLESAFRSYEIAIREGGGGNVAVLGGLRTLALLDGMELTARLVEGDAPELYAADLAILETDHPLWRSAADRLLSNDKDVILLASETADLADLLEAIALRLELVGYGGKNAQVLGDRVRSTLMRQAVQVAQRDLAAALTRFRGVLAAATK